MGLIAWIVFGAIAGWIASIITGNNQRQGCLMNIIVGVIGAFVGGLVVDLITGSGFSFAFNFTSFLVAVLGAVILLAIVGVLFKRR
jgi:uncharacterized membrane protein YeaQ/YmgE (transglycosylase-associated protein family)